MIKEDIDIKQKCVEQRSLLKSDFLMVLRDFANETDQSRGIDFPDIQKSYAGDIITLPIVDSELLKNKSVYDCIKDRRSRRKFTNTKISLNDLSFLLWSTQGIQKKLQDNKITLRTVPSGGARHPFETYLAVFNLDGLQEGIYRYLPLEHALTLLFQVEDMKNKIVEATLGQVFTGDASVTFIWSAVPYRTEWRYAFASAKTILLDCGHVCQNLYIACEALNLGTCAIAAYDQKKIDELLKLDGENEFTVYLAPVGAR